MMPPKGQTRNKVPDSRLFFGPLPLLVLFWTISHVAQLACSHDTLTNHSLVCLVPKLQGGHPFPFIRREAFGRRRS